MKVLAPESATDVLALLAEDPDNTRVMAGGTALVTMMRQRLLSPERLLSLHRLPAFRHVEVSEGVLRIGALVPQRVVEGDALVRQNFPVLAETLAQASNIRIRNVATLGGAIIHADPNQDSLTTLLALDASVTLRSRGGQRTVPLATFFVDYYETGIEPGELLTEILLPLPAERFTATFRKFLPGAKDDYGVVNVAVAIQLRHGRCVMARIALGCVGDTPLRALDAEAALLGQAPDAETIGLAAALAAGATDPVSDRRGSAAYKRQMTAVFVRRAIEALL